MATYKYLGDRNADGTILGYDSTEPIGFWGATPAARTAFTYSAVSTCADTTAMTSAWANSVNNLLNEVRAALVTIGLKA